MCGSADADVCFSVIHNDNIYNSANPELKRVNLEPACRDLEPLGSSREKTHVGEAEALRVLLNGAAGKRCADRLRLVPARAGKRNAMDLKECAPGGGNDDNRAGAERPASVAIVRFPLSVAGTEDSTSHQQRHVWT